MIWHSVLNGNPDTHCRCEVLLRRIDGDLEHFLSDYDCIMQKWLLPQISKENSENYEAVHYWRVL